MRKILFSAMLILTAAPAYAQEEAVTAPPAADMALPTLNNPASFAQSSFPELPPYARRLLTV